MPPLETMDLRQKAVLWAKLEGNSDRDGQPVVGLVPQEIRCRWNDDLREVVLPNGNTVSLAAVIVTAVDVPIGSILWKGSLEDLGPGTAFVPPDNLTQCVKSMGTPDIKNRNQRRTFGLMRFRDKMPTQR